MFWVRYYKDGYVVWCMLVMTRLEEASSFKRLAISMRFKGPGPLCIIPGKTWFPGCPDTGVTRHLLEGAGNRFSDTKRWLKARG